MHEGLSLVQGKEAEDFIANSCIELATDDTGWETLYQCKATGEYWVKTYPNSEMHGGGEAQVTKISKSEAKVTFAI